MSDEDFEDDNSHNAVDDVDDVNDVNVVDDMAGNRVEGGRRAPSSTTSPAPSPPTRTPSSSRPTIPGAACAFVFTSPSATWVA